MRAAHITAIERLDLKNEPRAFKRSAERVRTHLFHLSRKRAASSTDIIEKVCSRLNQKDRLDWNAGRKGRLEFRSLNDFGTWIGERSFSTRTSTLSRRSSITLHKDDPHFQKLARPFWPRGGCFRENAFNLIPVIWQQSPLLFPFLSSNCHSFFMSYSLSASLAWSL